MNPVTIGRHIAEVRKAMGLSQSLFASKFYVSPQAVGKWERGESLPDVIMLSKIAAMSNKDVCELLDIKDTKCNCGCENCSKK
jgi:transcriptional regulator with XRE-family HTH domain